MSPADRCRSGTERIGRSPYLHIAVLCVVVAAGGVTTACQPRSVNPASSAGRAIGDASTRVPGWSDTVSSAEGDDVVLGFVAAADAVVEAQVERVDAPRFNTTTGQLPEPNDPGQSTAMKQWTPVVLEVRSTLGGSVLASRLAVPVWTPPGDDDAVQPALPLVDARATGMQGIAFIQTIDRAGRESNQAYQAALQILADEITASGNQASPALLLAWYGFDGDTVVSVSDPRAITRGQLLAELEDAWALLGTR